MTNGTVKWFSDEKGDGCITPDDGSKDVHVLKDDVLGDAAAIAEGSKVSYELIENERGPHARQLSLLAVTPALAG